ncbi:unnamed protein product, partial [Ectocarpus fasciculatus]
MTESDTKILAAARHVEHVLSFPTESIHAFLVREALVLPPPLRPYRIRTSFTGYDATAALTESYTTRAGHLGACAWCTLSENTTLPRNIITRPFARHMYWHTFFCHLTRKKRFPSFSKSVLRMSTRRTRTF